MERLYKKLESYGQSDYYPFHMPGHKRNRASSADDFLFERDITEISGFDNLHHAEGILKEAQEYAAQIYGTKKCFFSVNGSTAALLAAVSASVNKGGKILVARNCHKAVYHALYLRELQPVYIYPHEDQRLGINGGISPERVERYLEENTDVQAFLLTSPTYDGVVSDIKTIAEVVHRHKIPLIVDEAHGAHLHYSKYFRCSAADLGADIVIQSFHKTLPSMTQTAVLHICSDMADVEKIKRFMGIYQTSSPSYILMASMDACMDKLRKDGQQMFREFTFNLEKARQRLSKCEKIKLIEGSMIEGSGIYDLTDPSCCSPQSELLLTDAFSIRYFVTDIILKWKWRLRNMFLELQQWEIQKRDLRDCVLQLKRLMQRYSKQMSRRNRSIILLMRE